MEEDPEQPAVHAEEKAQQQAISTELKKQWQPPAECQQLKGRAESTTEAPPSPSRPAAPYRYVKRGHTKPLRAGRRVNGYSWSGDGSRGRPARVTPRDPGQ